MAFEHLLVSSSGGKDYKQPQSIIHYQFSNPLKTEPPATIAINFLRMITCQLLKYLNNMSMLTRGKEKQLTFSGQ